MGIFGKPLIAVAAFVVLLVPHALVVLAVLVRAAVQVVVIAAALGPHMFVMLALTVALAVALFLAWRIDALTMKTGWSLAHCRTTVAGW